MKIKLVLSGSGTKFPVFAGALKRLEEEGLEVEEVIGTSGGSVIAAGLASGFSATRLIKLCKEIMPRLNKMVDFNVFRPLTEWGFIKGEKMKAELSKHFVPKMQDAKIPLHITATNFDTEKLEVFNSKTHPDVSVAQAVRASIAIPVVFVPEKINGDLYVDGGVKANFAIDHFNGNKNVVGLFFYERPGRKPRPRGLLAFAAFIGRVIDMLIRAKTDEDRADAKGVVQIPLSSSINGLDFAFDEEQVDQMIKEGYECVDEWLKHHPLKLKEK